MRHFPFILLLLLPIFLWAQVDEVIFSHNGGVYATTFSVELSCHNPNHHIRYTLNGTTPDANARLYTGALYMNRAMVSSSDIYKIQTSPSSEAFYPDTVMKAIVIRAAVFNASENRVSQVITQSYFIRSLGCMIHDLPVVSICGDSLSLFSADSGILVPGVFFNPDSAESTGNYIQRGREWERRVNVEFYTTENNGFNQLAGLRTHGGAINRRAQQKGLKLYARADYGKKNFKFKIFDELELSKFKHLVLKSFHSASSRAGVQDWLANHIASNMNVATIASRPVALFLNGEYWGIYFLQEKGDERYFEGHYDADPDLVNVIDNWSELENGSSDSFFSLYYWMMEADLSDSIQYQYFSEKVDIPSFIDYMIFELYSGNRDWPINNVRCWQDGPNPWRWLFYDGDWCFYDLEFDVYANVTYAEQEMVWPTSKWSTLFFRKLLQSETFVKDYLSRLNEVSNTCLTYRNTKPYLTKIMNLIQDEIPHQVDRFQFPFSVKDWENRCGEIDLFLRDRQTSFWEQTKLFFDSEENSIPFFCYPNPVRYGKLNIRFESEKNIVENILIYDMNGRLVSKEPIIRVDDDVSIFLQLSPGVYVVRIGQFAKKIVVM